MKLTKTQLKRIIKEELQKVLNEDVVSDMGSWTVQAADLRSRAKIECGRQGAQLEATLKTGNPSLLKTAQDQAMVFKQCEQGSEIEYEIEELAQDIGLQADRMPI